MPVCSRVRSGRAGARFIASLDLSSATSKGGDSMAKITKTMVGEALVGEGNEVAHIDLIIGPRGSPVETAFTHALTNNKDGFTSLLAVVAPNLVTKPATVMF